MGNFGSTLGEAQGYDTRAKKNAELADDILTYMFTKSNFKDILSLTTVEQCPRYIFTTAKALQTLFQKIQVYPKEGPGGEILFTSLAKASPGLALPSTSRTGAAAAPAKTEQQQKEEQARKTEQNKSCIRIAYFYIRAFQIYAALALTTINASPVKIGSSAASTSSNTGAKKGFQEAELFGGGAGSAGSVSTQSGGEITAQTRTISRRDVLLTLFAPFVKFFTAKAYKGIGGTQTVVLEMDTAKSNPPGKFLVYWSALTTDPTTTEQELQGQYVFRTGETRNIVVKITKLPETNKLVMSIGNDELFTFQSSTPGTYFIVDESGASVPNDKKEFEEGIHSYFAETEGTAGYAPPSSALGAAPSGALGVGFGNQRRAAGQANRGAAGAAPRRNSGFGWPASASFGASGSAPASASFGAAATGAVVAPGAAAGFEGVEQLRDIFSNRVTGFPKAFCVARAMILLDPIFESEKTDPRQRYMTHICNRRFPQFEKEGQEFMPRAGKRANNVLYFRSLISLYYDTYELDANQKFSLKQTPPGVLKLREASTKFADLYRITSNRETFLESNREFTSSPLCGNADITLTINDTELVQKLRDNWVLRLLKFQEEHTKKVNEFLKRMFTVTVKMVKDKEGKPQRDVTVKFADEIRKGGIPALNKIGAEAADLLLNYYMKSEAMYIKGVLLLEENRTKLSA